jgi:hypothetical protein
VPRTRSCCWAPNLLVYNSFLGLAESPWSTTELRRRLSRFDLENYRQEPTRAEVSVGG